MTIFLNADLTLGTLNNDLAGFVDTTSITWANTGMSTSGATFAFKTLSASTHAVATTTGTNGSAIYYGNSAVPQADYDVYATVYVNSTGTPTDNAGLLAHIQSPAGSTANYVPLITRRVL